MRYRRTLASAGLIAVALTLSACGGATRVIGSGSPTTVPSQSSTTSTKASTPTTAPVPSTTPPTAPTPTTAPGLAPGDVTKINNELNQLNASLQQAQNDLNHPNKGDQ